MIAFIPARGGSKGLPNKNIRSFCGTPLIAHSIYEARKAKNISRIVVSTDSQEIARIAKDAGAEIPFMRPDYLATDSAMAMDTYLYTCDRLEQEEKIAIMNFVVLQPTSPLRKAIDIDNAINLFQEKAADSVISVTEAPCPIQWHKVINEVGVLAEVPQNQNDSVKNRQEYNKTYVPNGAVYVFDRQFLAQKRRYYSEKTYPYIMTFGRSVDIDNQMDFLWAEYIYRNRILFES